MSSAEFVVVIHDHGKYEDKNGTVSLECGGSNSVVLTVLVVAISSEEAFEAIGRPPPEPKGTIDSLALLTQRFGRRAGNMKMATLATYFGLGQQTHRSLDDVRMNLEVLKYCATVLFLQ
ncbi:NEN2-like protein [Drosera capensis]